MRKTAEMIIDEDMRKLYLGNLNTVEFNLQLPKEGKQGSRITWFSDNELYLRSDGSVTRPVNGIGNRKVHLRGCFSYQGVEKEKTYEVHILEEESRIEIVEVLSIEREAEKGVLTSLPRVVILKGNNGQFFSRSVEWEGGNEQIFTTCGSVKLRGVVKDEKLPAELTVFIKERVNQEKKDTRPLVTALDNGETHLKKGSAFYDAMCRAVTYFKSVSEDEMLYNFRKAANLDTKGAQAMEGWDSPECLLRGHTTGHYLSALSLCFRETQDEEIEKKIHYIVEEMGRCQKAFESMAGYQEGYIGAYSEEQFDLLEKGVSYPDIWAPYYTLHKIMAGMLDAYCWAGEEEALEIAVKAGMWTYRRLRKLTKNEREKMWDTYIAGEFGGINETLTKLYEITGKEEFLETAKMFDNDRLFVPMEEKKDVLGGMHVNQHVPQIIGSVELFKATGEKRYYDIAEFFWKTVVEAHTYVNGGAGEHEMFFEANAAAENLTTETTEYCVSYNMLKLTKELYRYNPKAFYMDYYERCMFNHIVAGFDDMPTGDTTYFFPLLPGGEKEPKFANSCCHGTGMESQMKYTEAIFFHSNEELYVNLFLNSETVWEEKGVYVEQKVNENNLGFVKMHIEGDGEFILKIRCPYWCNGRYNVLVNNGKVIANCDTDGYISIKRYRTVENVEIQFQCGLRSECASGDENIRAWIYGPYVLAALSDKESFLEMNVRDGGPEKTEEVGMKFLTKGKEELVWKPLFDVAHEKYHVYWKRVS